MSNRAQEQRRSITEWNRAFEAESEVIKVRSRIARAEAGLSRLALSDARTRGDAAPCARGDGPRAMKLAGWLLAAFWRPRGWPPLCAARVHQRHRGSDAAAP